MYTLVNGRRRRHIVCMCQSAFTIECPLSNQVNSKELIMYVDMAAMKDLKEVLHKVQNFEVVKNYLL